jgi:hypothetical protein
MNNWILKKKLNNRDIEFYLKKIYSLKCNWIQRNKNLPFFSLGMAAYLDGPSNSYLDLNKRNFYNKILYDNFNDLYVKLLPILSYLLNCNCEIYKESAIPGFHIYMPNLYLKNASSVHQSSPHMDTQFKYVFPEKGLKQEDFVSFTLPLICSQDSGLNIWKPDVELPENVLDMVNEKSHINLTGSNMLSKYAAQSVFQKPSFIRYSPGTIFIHRGVFFHSPVLEADKISRITLQGHGVKKDGKFLLFW